MRILMALLFGATATIAVQAQAQTLPRGPLPGGGTEIDRLVDGPQLAHYCGGIGYIDLGSPRDAPAYYFRKDDGRVIARCGGHCEAEPENCTKRCPPPEWKCR